MLNAKPPEEYDGFYFLPGRTDEETFSIAFFNLKGEFENGKPIDSTSIGNCYHVAFFKRDANGDPAFDGAFEAIFADPTVYIEGLAGANIYGCVLKKTDKSSKWFAEYLEKTKGSLLLKKLVSTAKAILNTK
jgi:hypothetical protein